MVLNTNKIYKISMACKSFYFIHPIILITNKGGLKPAFNIKISSFGFKTQTYFPFISLYIFCVKGVSI